VQAASEGSPSALTKRKAARMRLIRADPTLVTVSVEYTPDQFETCVIEFLAKLLKLSVRYRAI
jgi:hypothetical protein